MLFVTALVLRLGLLCIVLQLFMFNCYSIVILGLLWCLWFAMLCLWVVWVFVCLCCFDQSGWMLTFDVCWYLRPLVWLLLILIIVGMALSAGAFICNSVVYVMLCCVMIIEY